MYTWPFPHFSTPGVSIPIALLLTILFVLPIYFVYAAFGSAMPRAGGDYLFQTRGLHPVIGFVFPTGWEILMWTSFTASGGFVLTTLGLVPMFDSIGNATGNNSFINAASWMGSSNGTFIITLIATFLAFLICVSGMKTYVKIQRWILVPAILITNLFLIIVLIKVSPSDFQAAFNAFHAKMMGDPDFYNTILQAARDNAYQTPEFSWKSTLYFLPVSVGLMGYTVFSAQGILGEVKSANNFKNLFSAFLLGGMYSSLIAIGLVFLVFQKAVGWDFLHAFSFVYYNGLVELPYSPNLSVFTSMLSLNPVLSVLLSIGFMANGFYLVVCVFLNMTRVMVSMGLDGTLPSWFAEINRKFHSPLKATTFFFAVSVVVIILFNFRPDWFNIVILGSIFSSLGVLGVTCLAAVFLPKRNPHIFKASPVGNWYIGPIPVLSLVGALGAICVFTFVGMDLFLPELGLTDPVPRFVIIGTLVFSLIFYYGYKYYRRAKGIDIDVSTEIPPE
ncbi:MAG: APC family permease [Bacillota bacterium]